MLTLDEIKKEYENILQQLADPELISDWPASHAKLSEAYWQKFEELTKRKNFLEKIIEKEKEIEEMKAKIEENKTLLKSKEGPELSLMAETEIIQFNERSKNLEAEIQKLLTKLPKEAKENKESEKPEAVIIEIRAGQGGEEAALFAADLFRMYSKYAQSQNWKRKVLDSRTTELGGFKEIIFELSNGNVLDGLGFEAGVHRVQRIPKTEKLGRVHTSTNSVAVLPKPKKAEIKIRPEDLKIDFYRASGPGGQYVNKRETAVRITHLPTGLVVTSQTERSQLQNKENAMSILSAKLLEKKQMAEVKNIAGKRKAQIGWAKRAEKIRTYNFPQDRVTDHRLKKGFHHIEEIMEGKLEPIISALRESLSA